MKKTKQVSITGEDLISAGIPHRFWDLGVDDYFGSDAAMSIVTRYLRSHRKCFHKGTSLLFRGERNSGKTFLLTFLLRSLMLEGYSVRYTTMPDFTDLMCQSTGREFYSEIVTPDILAIDGIDEFNDAHRPALSRVINRRRDEAKPLFLATTFLDAEEDFFAKGLGEPASRFFDISRTVNCSVNPFLVRKHHRQITKALRK